MKPLLRSFRNAVTAYKQLPVQIKASLWLSVAIILLIAIPTRLRYEQTGELRKARIYLSEPHTTIATGQTFGVDIRLQTNGTPVNAVSVHAMVNPAYVDIANITTENSFCTFYLENTFDTMKGTVDISCGKPNPGFLGDNVVVHMSLRAKTAGNTQITFREPDTQVLANDGKGSSVTQQLAPLEITISQKI